MRSRIDINEVEMRTKIRAKYLRAMENEEWGLLPGDVYVKSFLRTYAEFLGVDGRQLLDEYRRRYERPTDHEARPLAPLNRDRERRGGRPAGGGFSVPPWAAIAVAVVAIFAVLEVIGLGGGNTGGPTTTTQSSSSSLAATGHKKARTRSHHHASVPPVAGGGRTIAASTVKLALVPTGAVWVCLVDGSGNRLINGVIYDTGQTIPTKRASKLLLKLGNASVTMKVNGKPITVPSTGQPVGFEITPTATRPLTSAQQPSCP